MLEMGLAIQITYITSGDTYDEKVRPNIKFSSFSKFFENFPFFNIASIWQQA